MIFMQRYRLDSKLNFPGGFWPPNDQSQVITGILSSENRRIYLSTSPTFKKLDISALGRSFLDSNTALQRIGVLCGYTADGPCTLLDLMENTNEGCEDWPHEIKIDAVRWRVGGVVMGFHLDSVESEIIESAAFYLSTIEKWFPAPTRIEVTADHFSYTIPLKGSPAFEFSSLELEAEVTCRVFALKNGRSVPRIKVKPRTPKSLDWFVSVGLRLENFFSMFLGSSVGLTELQLQKGEEHGWLIQRVPVRNEKVSYQSWVRCEKHEMARALSKWLAVPESQQPVEITVLGMLRKSSLFIETEFLALAQALEGFGRIHFERGLIPSDEFKNGLTKLRTELRNLWGDSEIVKRCSDALSTANEASFGHRLGLTYDLLSGDFAAKLLGNRTEFIRRVVQTRNYFTHLGIEKGKYVADTPKELFLLNQRLHALLRCVMLLDLTVSEVVLRGPILYQMLRWKT
jgi:ApeA N-terminal domain 1